MSHSFCLGVGVMELSTYGACGLTEVPAWAGLGRAKVNSAAADFELVIHPSMASVSPPAFHALNHVP